MFTTGQLLALWAIVSCSRAAGAPALAAALEAEIDRRARLEGAHDG